MAFVKSVWYALPIATNSGSEAQGTVHMPRTYAEGCTFPYHNRGPRRGNRVCSIGFGLEERFQHASSIYSEFTQITFTPLLQVY